MGWVAIGYGAASAAALAIACCGPSKLAKICSAGLFISWLLSNKVFSRTGLDLTIEQFTLIDFAEASLLLMPMFWAPSRWIVAMFALTIVQLFGHIAYYVLPATSAAHYYNILVNNLLYATQLVMVTVPTLTMRRRRLGVAHRQRARRLVRDAAAGEGDPGRVRISARPHRRLRAPS